MKRINKTELGLGKLRNEILPTKLESNKLLEVYTNLTKVSTSDIKLESDPSNSDNIMTLDYGIHSTYRLHVDKPNYLINFTGGEEGKSFYLEVLNYGSHSLGINKLRSTFGKDLSIVVAKDSLPTVPKYLNPFNMELEESKIQGLTIYEFVLLGGNYYLVNLFRDDIPITLKDIESYINVKWNNSSIGYNSVRIIESPGKKLVELQLNSSETINSSNDFIELYGDQIYEESKYKYTVYISETYNTYYRKFLEKELNEYNPNKEDYIIKVIPDSEALITHKI